VKIDDVIKKNIEKSKSHFKEKNQNQDIFLYYARKRVIIFLIISIFTVNSLIVFFEESAKTFFVDITNIATTAAAIIMGFLILIQYDKKQIFSNIIIRCFLFFTIGLIFWCIANVIWTYYEVGLGINPPDLSLADVFWISAFFFFGYYFFMMYRTVTKPGDKDIVIYVSVAASISLGYIFTLTFGVAQIVSAQQDILATILLISYPLLDGIMLVPSIAVLLNLNKDNPLSLLWILLSSAMIFFIIGDLYYGYGATMGITDLNLAWMLYNAGYLCIAFGLYWHVKIPIYPKNI